MTFFIKRRLHLMDSQQYWRPNYSVQSLVYGPGSVRQVFQKLLDRLFTCKFIHVSSYILHVAISESYRYWQWDTNTKNTASPSMHLCKEAWSCQDYHVSRLYDKHVYNQLLCQTKCWLNVETRNWYSGSRFGGQSKFNVESECTIVYIILYEHLTSMDFGETQFVGPSKRVPHLLAFDQMP